MFSKKEFAMVTNLRFISMKKFNQHYDDIRGDFTAATR